MGIIRQQPLRPGEGFAAVNDERLRLSLNGMVDRYNQQIRELIYRTYQDDELAAIYRAIRASGEFQRGGRNKVRRKIIEFPNIHVYDFVNVAMTALYGPDWAKKREALTHELVRPWLVINL